jgi:hypothetical protein
MHYRELYLKLIVSRGAYRLTAVFCGAPKQSLTFEATGAQHAPRSGNLLLRVRVGRKVRLCVHGKRISTCAPASTKAACQA